MIKKQDVNKKPMSVFKQIRDKANMSQDELAQLLNVTPATVCRWEGGKHEPMLNFKQIKILSYLLRGMGLSLSDLPDNAFGEISKLS